MIPEGKVFRAAARKIAWRRRRIIDSHRLDVCTDKVAAGGGVEILDEPIDVALGESTGWVAQRSSRRPTELQDRDRLPCGAVGWGWEVIGFRDLWGRDRGSRGSFAHP